MVANSTYYSSISDEELFALVQRDDKKAFEQLYDRYWSFLLDYAYKPLQCRQKAEDLVQEIFISLYQRRNTITFSVSLRAYLSQALKFKVMNEYRSQVVREKYQRSISSKHYYSSDVAHHCETKELEHSIYRLVKLLPEKCKQVFLLSRNEDYSYKEISGGLGISVSTVEKHISKALKILKVNLNV
jgi:RNA polymerase sigma-70 factor (family 1)